MIYLYSQQVSIPNLCVPVWHYQDAPSSFHNNLLDYLRNQGDWRENIYRLKTSPIYLKAVNERSFRVWAPRCKFVYDTIPACSKQVYFWDPPPTEDGLLDPASDSLLLVYVQMDLTFSRSSTP